MADVIKNEKKAHAGTVVKTCKANVCNSSYQDERYGSNQRVHNSCTNGYRCTVCGNIIQQNK